MLSPEALSVPPEYRFILLIGVDVQLFKQCYGYDEEWPCRIRVMDERCNRSVLAATLKEAGLLAVVFQDDSMDHWGLLRQYYHRMGGFLVYFGIYGDLEAPKRLSRDLGLEWKFASYDAYEFLLTPAARRALRTKVTTQQYSKANLVRAPPHDRWMIPKPMPLDDFIEEFDAYDPNPDVIRRRYMEYARRQGHQSPMLLHKAEEGGRISYLGFVNGDGFVPSVVRSLLTS